MEIGPANNVGGVMVGGFEDVLMTLEAASKTQRALPEEFPVAFMYPDFST
jgi:hypothetical protein